MAPRGSVYYVTSTYDAPSQVELTEPRYSNKRWISPKTIAIILLIVVVLAIGIGLAVGLTRVQSAGPTPSPAPNVGCANWKPRMYSRDFMRKMTSGKTRWHEQDCLPIDQPECPTGFSRPPLLLVSLDGFRAEYLQRGFTPAIRKLGNCGVYTRAMRPVYPTKTFPNHYSIVTGLYPESHGIISNNMYDTDMKSLFRLGTNTILDPRWWKGEPIWNSVKKNGGKSATMFWPGSEVPIQGEYPDVCYKYNKSVPFDGRIKEVLAWLDLEEGERPDFMTIYLEEPDTTGHDHGPLGSKVNDVLKMVDQNIDNLMTGIENRNLEKCIDIIVVADHGMDTKSCSKLVKLPELGLNTSKYYIFDGTNGRISSKYLYRDGQIVPNTNGEPPESIVNKLECKNWYMDVYKKEELPKRYHYSNNKRIDEVVMDLDVHWQVRRTNSQSNCNGGHHGHDNQHESMQALFVAYGPSFKENLEVDTFENIELYNLMADILDVQVVAGNNGTKGSLSHLLKNPRQQPRHLPVKDNVYCSFPDRVQWESRFNQSDCICNISQVSKQNIWDWDKRLNLTTEQIRQMETLHLPLGVPQVDSGGSSVCQLTQSDYVVGFDSQMHSPIWTAFALQEQPGRSVLNVSRVESHIPPCLRIDTRISIDDAVNCSSFQDYGENITYGFLFHPGFSNDSISQMDSLISTNIVPMYAGFKDEIWKDAMLLMEEYNEKYGPIQVVTGPAYDYNADGHKDDIGQIRRWLSNNTIPLPTHFYLVASRCPLGKKLENCGGHIETVAIILPHRSSINNCKKPLDYLKDNVARIKDVELLTGLTFNPSLNAMDRVRLQTYMAIGLWKPMAWIDAKSCIPSDQPSCPWSEAAPVLLISLDGFRDSYLLRNLTPNIKQLSDCGVNTPYMKSIYPTLTFPNHYSIVTGLYPESHGIIDNSMYDLSIGKPFYLGSPNMQDPRWWLGEPLWNTVTKHNKSAMTVFWPGSDVQIQGRYPTKYFKYDGNYPNEKRVETILGWLDGSAGVKPDFMTLYFDTVDKAGHSGGENSIYVNESLVEVDTYIGQLMDGLYKRRLHNCVNIIILADHGMSDISCDRQVLLKDQIWLSNIYAYTGAFGRISNLYKRVGNDYVHLHQDIQTKVQDILKNMTCKTTHMKQFQKAHLAKRHHYAANDRIDPIILDLQEKWMVGRFSPILCHLKGMHAWDPMSESMRALFLAHGPAFKSQYTVDPFENIELYNLMADLLNITAAPNNGTRGSLYHLMKNPPPLPTFTGTDYNYCLFPADETEYQRRANMTCCCVNDTLPAPPDVRKWDDRLNLTQTDRRRLRNEHLPHGVPLSFLNESLLLLHHTDFVSAYSPTLKLPLWTAYTLTPQKVALKIGEPSSECSRNDVRMEPLQQYSCCAFETGTLQNITRTTMFPSGFSSDSATLRDGWVNTNFAPMWTSFRNGIWKYLLNQMESWVHTYGDLYVVSGPIFDFNYDGNQDTLETIQSFRDSESNISIPTHYYVILMRCPDSEVSKCIGMNYSAQSFILPHLPNITNCLSEDAYLLDNTARIRDIELLTGMQLLTANNTQAAILTRTYVPNAIWPTLTISP